VFGAPDGCRSVNIKRLLRMEEAPLILCMLYLSHCWFGEKAELSSIRMGGQPSDHL